MSWAHETYRNLFGDLIAAAEVVGCASAPQNLPFGLRGYPAFQRGFSPTMALGQMEWERPIVEAIGEQLQNTFGYDVVSSQASLQYPSYVIPPLRKGKITADSSRCDLRIRMTPDDEWLWIEAKIAYLQDLTNSRGQAPDWTGSLPLRSAWTSARNGLRDIAQIDVPKLLQLRSSDAYAIGVLLIAFDRSADSLTADRMSGTFLPALQGWQPAHLCEDGVMRADCFIGRANAGFRERFWLWYKTVSTT